MERNHFKDKKTSECSRSDYHYLMAEMKAQNFDVIRFATYRTASKLRFIQKKTNLHLLDIWNIIEAFRENGLNSLESRLEINVVRLETLINSIYYQLNKRLPLQQQIDVEHSSAVLVNWLLATYDPDSIGKLRVFPIKIALAIVCAGKITDKLRFIFSLISDVNGNLVFSKFVDFIREAMGLPCSVYESPSFYFTDSLPRTIFDGQSTITVNDFLDVLMSDPGPQCLMWFPLLHRMSSVESVLHTVQCEGCSKESFLGFRYKCQRCYNYQLCQDCFWRGRVSGNHTNQHEMKEYTSYKPPSKQLSQSLKKSFLCIPDKSSTATSHAYPANSEHSNFHTMPSSMISAHNGLKDQQGSNDTGKNSHNTYRRSSYEFYVGDDEHNLISQYTNRLYAHSTKGRFSSDLNLPSDTARQRELIVKLEAKNREIMREIVRLRKQQEEEDVVLSSERNPTLLVELQALRRRKFELESHLSGLQESRRDLVLQLEALMRMLKSDSPLSSPNGSPLSLMSRLSPIPIYPMSSMSAPATPGSGRPFFDPLMGLGGDVRMAFGHAVSTKSLQNDLLVAADSVTNAMSSLVKELNLGCEEEENGYISQYSKYGRAFDPDEIHDLNASLWSDDLNGLQGMQYEMGLHEPLTSEIVNENSNLYPGQVLVADDGSYIPVDEEDPDWENSMHRWVNR